MSSPYLITPRSAIEFVLADYRTNMPHEADIIQGLEQALTCLADMTALLRYIRARVPTYEPNLKTLITRQLIKGCDL